MTLSIAIDAMGGDRAPQDVVRGTVLAARSPENAGVHFHLVGDEASVRRELGSCEWTGEQIDVVASHAIIEMSDSPVDALSKKKGSSIEVATRLVRAGDAAALVSAGNTGACVAAAQLFLGRLKTVKRPGIAVVFYTGKNPVVIMDVGANVHAKPEHLVQYALMAEVYAKDCLGFENPRIGLLNVGEEDEKGSMLVKITRQALAGEKVNFIGNIEGADIFRDTVDIVVCDGFVGNIVLKASEALAENLLGLVARTLKESAATLGGAGGEISGMLEAALVGLKKRIDYSEFGGAPLLGVNGSVVIAHGRSDSKAISNAIGAARRMASMDLNGRILKTLHSSA